MHIKLLLFASCLFSISSSLNGQCLQGNCVNGKGVYRFNNGDLYVGSFDKMVPNGIGIMNYLKGQTREGAWDDGKFTNKVKTKMDSVALSELKTVYSELRTKSKTIPLERSLNKGINWTVVLAIITGIGITFGIIEKSLNIRDKIKKWHD